ncbi:SurA N-terminal domain-containing protein [Bacteriovoracaceae bacterium]|nr:SurA N-terminal domain-containing protein [Bacteriovoracaceae bacterium]
MYKNIVTLILSIFIAISPIQSIYSATYSGNAFYHYDKDKDKSYDQRDSYNMSYHYTHHDQYLLYLSCGNCSQSCSNNNCDSCDSSECNEGVLIAGLVIAACAVCVCAGLMVNDRIHKKNLKMAFDLVSEAYPVPSYAENFANNYETAVPLQDETMDRISKKTDIPVAKVVFKFNKTMANRREMDKSKIMLDTYIKAVGDQKISRDDLQQRLHNIIIAANELNLLEKPKKTETQDKTYLTFDQIISKLIDDSFISKIKKKRPNFDPDNSISIALSEI